MTETKTRSLVKSIVWRIIATVLTGIVAYGFTGNISTSSKVTLVSAAVSMGAYYWHERMWTKLRWGIVVEVPFAYPEPYRVIFDPNAFGGKPVLVYKNEKQ